MLPMVLIKVKSQRFQKVRLGDPMSQLGLFEDECEKKSRGLKEGVKGGEKESNRMSVTLSRMWATIERKGSVRRIQEGQRLLSQ